VLCEVKVRKVHVVALVQVCVQVGERGKGNRDTRHTHIHAHARAHTLHHQQAGRRGRGVEAGGCAAARDGLGLDAHGEDGVVAVQHLRFGSDGEVGDAAACVWVCTRP
jgi:hypothetical protein